MILRSSRGCCSLFYPTVLVALLVAGPTVHVCRRCAVDATSLILNIPPHDEECFLLRLGRTSKPPPPPAGTDSAYKTRIILEGSFEQIDDSRSSDPLVVHVVQEVRKKTTFGDKEVTERDDKVLYKARNAKRSNFRVPLSDVDGKYWLCVQNHKRERKGSSTGRGDSDSGDDGEDDDSFDDEDRVVGFSYNILYEKTFDGSDGANPPKLPGPIRVAEQHSDAWLGKAEHLHMEMRRLVQHHDYMRAREASHRRVTERTFSSVLSWTVAEAAVVIAVVRRCLCWAPFVPCDRSPSHPSHSPFCPYPLPRRR